MELKVSPINQLPIHINIIDIFKIAEIKNAAAEAQKFATTVKELNAVCEKYGFTSLDEFLEKAEDYKNGNALDSGSKKTKSGKRRR